jgi:NADPH:quinone reductase-like Zn-dependent oxidoreductase
MQARAVNPSDLIPIRGAYAHRTPLPRRLGFEGIGTVDASGPETGRLRLGDRVLPLRGSGTWADWTVAEERWCIRVPDSIGDSDAAQLYINPITAWLLLTRESRLKRGDLLIANAGGSSFVRILVQMARLLGVRTLVTIRNPVHRADLESLGADGIALPGDDIAFLSRTLSGDNAGPAAAFDAVGGPDGDRLAALLRPGATYVHYGLMSGMPLHLSPRLTHARGLQVLPYHLRHWVAAADERAWQEAFAAVMALVASGRVRLPRTASFALDDVGAAIRASERPPPGRKVVLAG